MGLLKNLQGSRFLMIQLVCWLGWLSSFGIAQFDISEGVTGSVNFPTLGITCVANLAVFVTSLIRGRLDLEIGARDALHILASPKLENINGMDGNGLTTTEYLPGVSVVMLSNGAPNSSIREFVKSNADYAHSILLEFFPLGAVPVPAETCVSQNHNCNCVVFSTVEDITLMLIDRMPGTLKLLSDSLCLLPCLTCLTAGCHGCNEGLLRVEGRLPVERESDSKLVSEILDKIEAGLIGAGKPICICIPMYGARDDVWTSLLVRILRSKDAEGRGARVMASEALEWYLAGGRGGQEGTVQYGICSFIVPRLTEVVITLVLTFWFRVDGFSSSLVARRTIRDFLVDTKGTGFAANAFLTEAVVQADNNNTQVCQILRFRGNRVGIRSLSFIVGCVDFISSLGWAVLIAFEGGADSSPPPSMPIVAVIIVAIGTALVMDAAAWVGAVWWAVASWLEAAASVLIVVTFIAFSPVVMPMLCLCFMWRKDTRDGGGPGVLMIMTVISLETAWIVIGSTVAGTLGMKVFGRWIYGAFQILVWVKWAAGSYALNEEISLEFFGRISEERRILSYSSAFLLNAVLPGVRCKWEAWPWKENHLFSRKLGP